mmetsp:Transcript_34724/g.6255  ORF Transcript_34724/g.6255 Transcript_34724/m.6255 type:complete len:87 (+) Transcript_34724:55-315(+)
MEGVHSADIEKIDDYIEEMYSDSLQDKLEAVKHLLILSQDAECLEYMINHENVFGVLARTLRDEYRKSMDLSLYITTIFFILSNYS